MTGTSAEGRERIVVGVDGSEGSRQALRWAVRQAGFTGAVVEAVTAGSIRRSMAGHPATGADTDFAGLGLVEVAFGINAERKSLEIAARPLTEVSS